MFHIMRILAADPFFINAAVHSDKDMFEEPTNRHIKAMIITAASMINAVIFFRPSLRIAISFPIDQFSLRNDKYVSLYMKRAAFESP